MTDPRAPWGGLLALLSGTFAVVLSLSFLFPATPIIMQDFSVSIEAASWLSLAYALGATVFEPMFGRLGDLYGRKRNALLGLGVFSLGAVVAAASPAFWLMLAARFVQGLGAAAVIPVGMAFVGEHFPDVQRGRALGLWSMVNASAPAIGPTLGGMLIDLYGWRSIYWASLLLGGLGLTLVARFVPESRRHHPETFDYAGSAALFVAASSLLTLLTQGNGWGWTSVPSLGLLALAVAAGWLFLRLEARVAQPIVDLQFARSRAFLVSGGVVFLSFLVFQGSFFLLPFFLEQVQGYSARAVGTLAMPLFIALALASFAGGRLSDRFPARHLVVAGTVLTGLAVGLLTRTTVETPYGPLLVVMALLGLGVGVTLPPLSRSVIGLAEPRRMGAISGVFNMFRNFGGPVGIALGATVFGSRAAVHAQEALVRQAAMLGVPPDVLAALAQSGRSRAELHAAASALATPETQLPALQAAARALGMASALVDVAWVLLGLVAFTLLVALLLPPLRPIRRGGR